MLKGAMLDSQESSQETQFESINFKSMLNGTMLHILWQPSSL